MSGQQLYALYGRANLEVNCSVDDWEELTQEDQSMWERLAELVQEEG